MEAPRVLATEKVMGMVRPLVYLALCVGNRRGATADDISEFVGMWAPAERNLFQPALVQRSLCDLQLDGCVTEVGARWYFLGHA